MKFKVGDKVKAVNGKPKERIGTVVETGSGITKRAYLVYFPGFDGHDGNGCSKHGSYKTKEYWYMYDEELELIQRKQETIVIYCKGQEVIALDKSTGEKAVAKCNPKDEFKFRTGAKLAFDRLMGEAVKKVPFKPGLAIWCDNKEEYDALMNQLDARGYKWTGGTSLTEDGICCGENVRIFVRFNDRRIEYDDADKQCRSLRYTYDYVDFPQVEFDDNDILYNGKVVCVDVTINGDFYTAGRIYEFKGGYITADDGEVYPLDPVHSFKEWQEYTTSKFIEIMEDGNGFQHK